MRALFKALVTIMFPVVDPEEKAWMKATQPWEVGF
jgi:hypothetical protein